MTIECIASRFDIISPFIRTSTLMLQNQYHKISTAKFCGYFSLLIEFIRPHVIEEVIQNFIKIKNKLDE